MARREFHRIMGSNGLLSARGITYCYHNQPVPVVHDASLTAGPGEQVLVTGPSGCGKSTFVRCLAGLIPHLYKGCLQGEVWIDGLHTVATPLWQLVEKAGMVMQNPQAQMLASTVEDEIIFGLENLGLASDEIEKRLAEVLKRFGLEQLRYRDPRHLSGGEGQKVILAAILARRPPVLVLDEPLSMLDTTAAGELLHYLGELSVDAHAVVVCEHRSHYFEAPAQFREYRLGSYPDTGESREDLPLPLDYVRPFHLIGRDISVTLSERRVLESIALDLSGGEVVALAGCNGSGKTTLLRSLVGLQKHGGSVSATDGRRVDLGLVYQNPDLQLFNPTVREEILYRIDAFEDGLYRWLITGLGLEHYEGVSPLLLSEGEKKRLCLAMVLMHRPGHGVLLDEPTLGQDDRHRRLLGSTARSLAGTGRLVMVATHDLSWVLNYATRLMVIHEGHILADGEPIALLRDHDLLEAAGLRVPRWVWEPII